MRCELFTDIISYIPYELVVKNFINRGAPIQSTNKVSQTSNTFISCHKCLIDSY